MTDIFLRNQVTQYSISKLVFSGRQEKFLANYNNVLRM